MQLLVVYSVNVLLVVTAFSELAQFFQCFLQMIAVLWIIYFWREKTVNFAKNGEVPFKYLKTFVVARFTIFFIGSQFISLSSLAPI